MAGFVALRNDVHSLWVNDLIGEGSAPIGGEIVTSALAAASPPADRFGDVTANNPHVRFHDLKEAGWTMVDIGRAAVDVSMRAVEDRTLADAPSRTIAKFVSPPGSRSLRPA